MSNYKKKNTVKWVLTAIAFVLVFVLLIGVCIQLFAPDGKKVTDWFSSACEHIDEDGDGICDSCGEEMPDDGENANADGETVISETESNGVSLVSAKIARSEYAENGISEYAESAYTITATISPSDASLKSGTFSIAWKNSSSDWATGKTVTDYASLTQSGLTATFVCKQAFGEQIILTFTASQVADETPVSATCTIDYCKRVTGVSTLNLSCMNYVGTDDDYDLMTVFTYDFVRGDAIDFYDHSYVETSMYCLPTYGVGSVSNNFSYTYTLSLATDMVSTIKNITGVAPVSVTFGNANFKTLITTILGNGISSNSVRASLYNAFYSKYSAGTAAFVLTFTATDSRTSEVSAIDVPVKFNPAGLGVAATSVSLSNTSLYI